MNQMKTVIIYGTKSGASRECAQRLGEEIVNTTIIDIDQVQPNIEEFTHVIIGAGVRNDKMYKPIRDFLKKNQTDLLSKTIACYLCNSKPKTTEAVIAASIPEAIRAQAIEIVSFGGYKPSWVPVSPENKLKGIDLERISEFAQHYLEHL
ncbi:flavodoxin domain-containing protein [Enterococcus rotai]|uniref:flavodoxin domain-containing protein n=1 Tax=Enterococcus rotai TaxID=118060 RepID=UPI0035C71727